MPRIEAPFTEAQVEALKRWQDACVFHPYTCPGNLVACAAGRELLVTAEGMVCQCGAYRQTWAHALMVGGGRHDEA